MNSHFTYYSPLGPIIIGAENNLLTQVCFSGQELNSASFPEELQRETTEQLDAYFQGTLFSFNLPLFSENGTNFQQQVWQTTLTIPYGQTRTYGQLANILGNKRQARTIGMANARNQLLLLIPCHRVIGAGNQLSGYAGGIWRKKWLLQHERNHCPLFLNNDQQSSLF